MVGGLWTGWRWKSWRLSGASQAANDSKTTSPRQLRRLELTMLTPRLYPVLPAEELDRLWGMSQEDHFDAA